MVTCPKGHKMVIRSIMEDFTVVQIIQDVKKQSRYLPNQLKRKSLLPLNQ